MAKKQSFESILEAVGSLALPDQEALIDVLRSRVRDQRRRKLARDISEARKELHSGRCKPAAPSELMKEILS